MDIDEFADGFLEADNTCRARGIRKLSANNFHMLTELEQKKRRAKIRMDKSFTKADEERQNTLYKMRDFIGS